MRKRSLPVSWLLALILATRRVGADEAPPRLPDIHGDRIVFTLRRRSLDSERVAAETRRA
jgi:hypothetical protein